VILDHSFTVDNHTGQSEECEDGEDSHSC
jgi:hypothetical protein